MATFLGEGNSDSQTQWGFTLLSAYDQISSGVRRYINFYYYYLLLLLLTKPAKHLCKNYFIFRITSCYKNLFRKVSRISDQFYYFWFFDYFLSFKLIKFMSEMFYNITEAYLLNTYAKIILCFPLFLKPY